MAYTTDDVYNKPHDEKTAAGHLAIKHDFDLEGALKQGYTHKDVVAYLNIKEQTQDAHLELIMCPPKYLSAKIANNKWMKKMSGEDKEVNVDKAMAQFFDLYGLLAQDAIVYLLPPERKLQDQVYISNCSMYLPHVYRTIILANYTAPGRPGEEKVLSQFLNLMEFAQYPCPHKFEGEAEMKWLRDNIYFCGYGMRSEMKAFRWMAEKFGCDNIYIKMEDPLRYHLDCNVFAINSECVLLAEDIIGPIKKETEKHAEIVPVSKKDAQFSLTNAVRVGSIIYNATEISELKKTDENYLPEKHKNESLEKIVTDKGLSMVWVNLSELGKSGAALSCTICHLRRIAYPA
jgi:N-dimethylarginine dimethylaminohydrolase